MAKLSLDFLEVCESIFHLQKQECNKMMWNREDNRMMNIDVIFCRKKGFRTTLRLLFSAIRTTTRRKDGNKEVVASPVTCHAAKIPPLQKRLHQ